MGLLKLLVFNMTLIFVGFYICTFLDRLFGLGTVNKLVIVSVVLAFVILMYKALGNDKA